MGRLEGKARLMMNRCYFCQGTVKPKRVTHVHAWKGKVIILEDVPADVCQQCGETYFAPEVLKAMDRLADGQQQEETKRRVMVPVYSLSGL
jgi:YgiT-type zinc finger domain-containing protein